MNKNSKDYHNQEMLEMRVNRAMQFYPIEDVKILEKNGKINIEVIWNDEANASQAEIEEGTALVGAAFSAYCFGVYKQPLKLSQQYTDMMNMLNNMGIA